ncbi:MAG: hypothetical protein M3552_10015 [Planctomycetota bacterium]|nr:hypothetical protein [Planctomycetaceae bacterium]MDQ3330974.1 hypothetical protein [Planctomycetota bacterium]
MPKTSLLLFALMACLAGGCDDATQPPAAMEIDANSTTNPVHYNRDIPESAVQSNEGTERTSEQAANTEDDAAGPPQEDSLAGAYNLDDQRGHPVLLVFAGGPDVPEYEHIKAAWRQSESTAKNSGVVLVESLLKGRSPEAGKTLGGGESQVMRSRYGIQPAQFKVILIDANGDSIDEWEGEEAKFDEVLKALES